MSKIYDILSSIISRLKGVEKKVDSGSSSGIEVSDTEPTNENTVLWIDPDEEAEVLLPEIKDDEVSTTDTWSSNKISSFVDAKLGVIENGTY